MSFGIAYAETSYDNLYKEADKKCMKIKIKYVKMDYFCGLF